MSAKLKALYELQVIDLKLARARRLRANLDVGTAQRQKVEAARATANAADESLKSAMTEQKDKELQVKTIETKRKQFHEKLYGGKVTNPKELSSIEKEIEMLDRQRGTAEERIIELMDVIEERKNILAKAEEAVNAEEAELAAIIEKSKKDNAALISRIKALLPMREKAASEVDPVLLKRYELGADRYGGVFLSKVEDGDCSACHTRLGSGTLTELKADTELVRCDNCGRILYMEE